jgi:uncharacterized protein YbaA (DUF1428 family)
MGTDGFLRPVKRGMVGECRALVHRVPGIRMAHGAPVAVMAMGDDVPDGVHRSFRLAVQRQPDEAEFPSCRTSRDPAHRDGVDPRVPAGPHMEGMPGSTTFDGLRMRRGGFVPVATRGIG